MAVSKHLDGVKELLNRSQYGSTVMIGLLAGHLGLSRPSVYGYFAGTCHWGLNHIHQIMEFLELHRIDVSLPEVLEHMLIDRNRRTEGGSE